MKLTLNTNIASLTSQYNLSKHSNKLNKSFEKVATGSKINSAADDAAGTQISDQLMLQIRGRNQAVKAAKDGIGVLNIAEGSLSAITESVQRIRELTVSAANDTNSTTERRALVQEVQERLSEIDRISNATKFNQVNLLDGSASQFKIQVGIDSDVNKNTINIGDVLSNSTSSGLGFGGLNITAAAGGIFENGTSIRSFIDNVDNALNTINALRSDMGAYSNRLSSTLMSTENSIEQYSRSYSSIKDADIAKVTSEITKENILRQSSLNIMMQANSNPNVVLSLLAA